MTNRTKVAHSTVVSGELGGKDGEQLAILVRDYGFSRAAGDLQILDGKWYVTHSGLLRLAQRNGCSGIHTETVTEFCDPRAGRWIVKATVFKTARSKGFVGYGDADPTNVSSIVRGAEMRVAETRAVNRALRKAYGIGLCSVEELGTVARKVGTIDNSDSYHRQTRSNGQSLLRDRLLVIIREHRLDGALVKRYAARYCGTKTLRDATREQVERFIEHLAARAEGDREKLIIDMKTAGAGGELADSEASRPETTKDAA